MPRKARVTRKTASLMISYSRKDKVFVKQLYESLLAQGFSPDDIWVDWEGIPLSADWMAEITKGIRSSNAFIFVIGPDSVASEVCRKEIEIAVESNKRFIPILYREARAGMQNFTKRSHPIIGSTSATNRNLRRPCLRLSKRSIRTLDWLAQHTRLFQPGQGMGEQGAQRQLSRARE
ncbi:MAG: toll/interleukin-1 receptor domain-containing protein [Ignavibacteriales bacterium]|nr:toll/interleukin-1 receptor domain-containing protein [Ignavibacteriales bacterium]